MKFLDGYGTFIGAGIIGIATALQALGILDQQQYETILGIAGAFTAVRLRSAIGRPT